MGWLLTLAMLGQTAPPSELRGRSDVCRDLRTQLQSILTTPALEDAKAGVFVDRLDNGGVLFAHNPDMALVPASNVKIITTAAALHYLGIEHRFFTEVYGKLDDRGVVTGGVYIRGDGDPWLLPERIWYLANRLYYLGVRQIRGDIIVDDSYFDGPRDAAGWEQDRTTYSYMAPRGALSVGFNTVLVHIKPAPSAREPAEVLIEPRSGYPKLHNTVRTVARGRTRLTIDVIQDGDRSRIEVGGQISMREPARGYYRRIDNPPIFAGEVLKTALKQAGVSLRGARVRTGIVPDELDRIARVASPRLSDLIDRVNKHSNNFMAEQVALATGAAVYGPPGNWDKAQRAIDSFLTEVVGLKPSTYAIRNASGLHDVNRMSPQQFVAVLDYMYRQPRFRPEFVRSMSVAGTAGTLSARMRDTEANGLLRAKTGTLSIASALSGYVTARRGEPIAFSVLVNDYAVPIADIWAVQDEIGNALASYDSHCGRQKKPAISDYEESSPVPYRADGIEVALP